MAILASPDRKRISVNSAPVYGRLRLIHERLAALKAAVSSTKPKRERKP